MVFEFGMGDVAPSRTMRADNYALSEETKRMRDQEQARLTDHAYDEALAARSEAPRILDRVADALLEKETLARDELLELFGDVAPESRASETVGVIRRLRGEPRRSARLELARSSDGRCAGAVSGDRARPTCSKLIVPVPLFLAGCQLRADTAGPVVAT